MRFSPRFMTNWINNIELHVVSCFGSEDVLSNNQNKEKRKKNIQQKSIEYSHTSNTTPKIAKNSFYHISGKTNRIFGNIWNSIQYKSIKICLISK